jgi:hypothetical protein
MQVGQITGTTFDIDSIPETDSLLVRLNGLNKFIWKDAQAAIHILQKVQSIPEVVAPATLLKMSDVPGYAYPVIGNTIDATVCAKTVSEISWDNLDPYHVKTFTDANGVARTAALVPVVIY